MIAQTTRRYILATSGLICILHLWGWLSPDGLNWGFHFLGFLSPLAVALFILLWITVVVISYRQLGDTYVDSIAAYSESQPYRFLTIILILFVLFAFMFRVKASLLGDSFTIINNFQEYNSGKSSLAPWHEPFSMYFFYYAVRAFSQITFPWLFWSFLSVEILLGLVCIGGIFLIIRHLFTEPAQRLLAFLFVLTPPYMIFFFGYIEIYAFSFFVLVLFVLLSTLVIKGKLPFYVVPICYVILTFSHYVNGLLGISVLVLAYFEFKQNRLTNVIIGFIASAIFTLLIFTGAGFDITNLMNISPVSHQLSLTEDISDINKYSQAYTLFSIYHLTDILNYLVLMSPLGIVLLMIWLGRHGKSMFAGNPLNIWFVSALAPVVLYLFIAKLEQGFADDWDVFASFFFIVNLFAAVVFFQCKPEKGTAIFTSVLLFSVVFSSPWFVLNAKTNPSIQRFQTLWDKRNVSHLGQYTMALRLTRYYDAVNDSTHQSAVWQNYRNLFPDDPRGYENEIATLQMFSPENFERKIEVYEAWMTLEPRNEAIHKQFAIECFNTGTNYYNTGNFDSALVLYAKAIRLDSTHARAYNNLGTIYAMQGNIQKALPLFIQSIRIDSLYSDAFYNLGIALEETGKKEEGKEYIERAAALGNAAAQESLKEK